MNYNWDWRIFAELEPGASGTYLAYLIGGLGWTVVTALLAWTLALLLGVMVGTLRTLGRPAVEKACLAYTELFRNIPLLVQMFLWYFVFPELLPQAWGDAIKQMSPPWSSLVPAVLCSILCLPKQHRHNMLTWPRCMQLTLTIHLEQCLSSAARKKLLSATVT